MGPNYWDEPVFYNKMKTKRVNLGAPNIIKASDFNLVLDPSGYYYNYKHVNNPSARQTLEDLIQDMELCDIWREFNPDCHR